MRRIIIIAVLALAGIGIALSGISVVLSHSGPGTITSHGSIMLSTSGLYSQDPATAFPDVSDGGQVTVINSAGTVIGTGTLMQGPSTSLLGGYINDDVLRFTVRVPAGLPRYGIEIGQDRGTVWFTARQMSSGPELSLSDLGDRQWRQLRRPSPRPLRQCWNGSGNCCPR